MLTQRYSHDAGRILEEFCWVECGVKRPGYFRRHIVKKVSDIDAFRREYANTGIFTTAYRYMNEDLSGPLYAPFFYIDLDSHGLMEEEAGAAWALIRREFLQIVARLDTYWGITREHVYPYFSGAKGLSILIPSRTLGLEIGSDVNEMFRLVAHDLARTGPGGPLNTIDLRIYDRVRLWRLANSRHEATGLYKIPLCLEEVCRLSIDEIRRLAESPGAEHEFKKAYASRRAGDRLIKLFKESSRIERKESSRLEFEPPCIESVLNRPVGAGCRNNTITILASYYLQRGLSLEEAVDRLVEWNSTMCSPSLSVREVKNTAASVYRGGYTFGCRTFVEMGLCSKERCKIARHKSSNTPG